MTPTPTTEDRLRATLRAVAEAEPVADDLDDLRARAGDHAVALDPPRRPPSRRLLAAAAVVALLAAGAVLVAARDDGGADEGVRATDPTAATGWYLPQGLGSEWELTAVERSLLVVDRSMARSVVFQGTDGEGLVIALEHLVDTPASEVGGVPVDRRGGGLAPVRVPEEPDPDLPRAWAQRGDRLLVVDGPDLDLGVAYGVLDTWWASGGLDISVDASLELVRSSDEERAGALPGPAPVPAGDGSRSDDVAIVTVGVRHVPSGEDVAYALAPEGARGLPTGTGDADGGAARGLAPGVQVVPVDLPDAPGPVWSAPEARWAIGHGLLAGSFPGAEVRSGFAPQDALLDVGATDLPPTAGPEDGSRDRSIELLGALRPVTAAGWAAAVEGVAPDGDLAAPTLAELEEGAPLLAVADPDPAGMAPRDPETVAAARALVAFAHGPTDETFAALPLAETVQVGAIGGEDGGRDPERAAAELREPGSWVVEGPPGAGPLSALDLLAGADALRAQGIFGGPEGCPTYVTLDSGPGSLAIEPSPRACLDGWFSVLVVTSGGAIVSVAVVVDTD